MTASKISAIYRDTGVIVYKGNPFIEALEDPLIIRASQRC
jgi:hypothetical protein